MFIQPSDNSYDPDMDLQDEGEFMATCTRVKYDLPNKTFPDQKSIAIDFTLDDSGHPELSGKRCSIVCTQSLYQSPKGDKRSYLVGYLLQAGIKDPHKGCNIDVLIGKRFRIQCIRYQGRVFVRGLMPERAGDPPQVDAAAGNKPLAPKQENGKGKLPF